MTLKTQGFKVTLSKKGFTLIELLVVISIIGALSTTVLFSLNKARSRSRDTLRTANLVTIRNVLEMYHEEHGIYPKTFEPGQPIVKRSECFGYPDDYIPGVVPKYIGELPSDPILDCPGVTHSWVYASDGIDYKIVTHNENFDQQKLPDPFWDSGANPCLVDGTVVFHIAVYTPGAACWEV